MSENIKETVPKVLKTLWDLENELRGAAQNSVMFRRDEARRHLAEARRHLDELLGMARSADLKNPEGSLDQRAPAPINPTDSPIQGE